MASTGQSSGNTSLGGTSRAGGTSIRPGPTSIVSPALRKRQVAGSLVAASTDQVTIGGVVLSNSAFVGMATAGVRQLVPAVLEQASALSAAARRLLPGESIARNPQTGTTSPGAFAQRTVTVSGGAGVTAAAIAGATVTSYAVSVTQAAAGQTSSSNGFVSNGTTINDLTGSGSLTVTIGSTTTTVTPNFSSATNAKEALEAIATAVNAAGIDVTAQVNSAYGGSALAITRKTTGSTGTFTLGGGVATALGFSTTTAARDASFTIDGASMTSSSNVIQLDTATSGATTGRVQLHLAGPTASTVTVRVGVARNDNAIVDAVQAFIDRFNVFRQSVAAMAGILTAGTQNQLDGALDGLRDSLRAIGIVAHANGTLALDTSVLRAALKSSPAAVESAIGGAGGLAARAFAVTSAIQKAPGQLFAGSSATTMPTGSQIAQSGRIDLASTKRLLDLQA